MGLSRGFKAFLVASALFLWFLGMWARGPGMATAAVGIVALAVIAVVFGVAAASYLGILGHELGHAVAAVALSPGRPLIEIGAAPRRLRLSVGRIDMHLGVRPGQAHCVPPGPLSRPRRVLISAAGPLASAVVAGCWLWVGSKTGGAIRLLALLTAVIEALHAVINLIPQEFDRPDDHGRPRTLFSDGAHIAAVLRNRPLRPAVAAPPAPSEAPPVASGASPRGRLVVAAMLQFAHAEGADAVGTEHLLRALATADERTHEILQAHGWTGEAAEPAATGEPAATDASKLPPPTPALRCVLDKTRDTVSLSGHSEAEPEHFLLALLRAGDNSALAALRAAGLDFEGLRKDLIAVLAG